MIIEPFKSKGSTISSFFQLGGLNYEDIFNDL